MHGWEMLFSLVTKTRNVRWKIFYPKINQIKSLNQLRIYGTELKFFFCRKSFSWKNFEKFFQNFFRKKKISTPPPPSTTKKPSTKASTPQPTIQTQNPSAGATSPTLTTTQNQFQSLPKIFQPSKTSRSMVTMKNPYSSIIGYQADHSGIEQILGMSLRIV